MPTNISSQNQQQADPLDLPPGLDHRCGADQAPEPAASLPAKIGHNAPPIPNAETLRRDIEVASDSATLRELEAKADGVLAFMRQAGLYNTEQIRPFTEARHLARWRLGKMLAEIERGAGPGRGKKEGGA